MAVIGMTKKNGLYFPSYQFSRDGRVVEPQPFDTFEGGLTKLLGECHKEITSGALREPLNNESYDGLTPDQQLVMENIICLYNEVVGCFPKR